jgi:serine/threonine protein kinase
MKDLRVEEIFNAALQKGSAVERVAYLDGACGSNADLRGRVETLLRAHDEADRFLEPTSAEPHQPERPGAMVGRYKLLQSIGEGGFGVVYMAEQIEPVRRKVALKIIKLGMDTKQVVARFESERQALALMDHPNIARVLDAGSTDSGRPYFVMELVKGIPITEYCDQNNLSPRERLELFIPVCQAIQHAHQKGIIHRDLKPTNVLVTLHDGRPVPKVIDFGIAKATTQRLTEKTLFTEFRQFIGTPQYMSPEQAGMSGLDVDTRSDIYSLGVLLYELLTGTTPFAAETLRAAGFGEMQRIIREKEPTNPWVRVSTMREELATIAKHRGVEPIDLPKLIRGDLDWIVMKCLEKDRTRRYETASGLAAELERYLKNEPVHATPPSIAYKLRKFVLRNKVGVAAGATVGLALCIGIGLATTGLVLARNEAERARNEAVRANQEADRATREAERSQAIADFLQEILASVDPEEAAKRGLDVERVVTRARELFGNDHATVAATLSSLALQLQHSGNLIAAEPLYRESIRIWRNLYGERHTNVGLTLGRLGSMLRQKGDEPAAEQALRETLEIAAELPDESNLAFCDARCELAQILQKRGKLDEAEVLVCEALRIRRLRPTAQEFQVATTLEQLVGVLSFSGKDAEAESAFEEMIAAYRPVIAPDTATAAWLHLSYGLWLRQRGKNEKAEPYLREAIRVYRLSPNPPRDLYAVALDGLFQVLRKREEAIDETVTVFHETMDAIGHLYGRDHLLIAPHLMGFAQMLEERDRAADAIPLVIDGIRIYRKSKGDDWDATSSLKMLERFVRRLVLAPDLSGSKYEIAARGAETLMTEQPDDANYRALLGMAQYRLGQLEKARAHLAPSPDAQSEARPEHQPQQLAFLAMTQLRSGESEKAHKTIEEVRELLTHESMSKSKDNRTALAEAEALMSAKPSNE